MGWINGGWIIEMGWINGGWIIKMGSINGGWPGWIMYYFWNGEWKSGVN